MQLWVILSNPWKVIISNSTTSNTWTTSDISILSWLCPSIPNVIKMTGAQSSCLHRWSFLVINCSAGLFIIFGLNWSASVTGTKWSHRSLWYNIMCHDGNDRCFTIVGGLFFKEIAHRAKWPKCAHTVGLLIIYAHLTESYLNEEKFDNHFFTNLRKYLNCFNTLTGTAFLANAH